MKFETLDPQTIIKTITVIKVRIYTFSSLEPRQIPGQNENFDWNKVLNPSQNFFGPRQNFVTPRDPLDPCNFLTHATNVPTYFHIHVTDKPMQFSSLLKPRDNLIISLSYFISKREDKFSPQFYTHGNVKKQLSVDALAYILENNRDEVLLQQRYWI